MLVGPNRERQQVILSLPENDSRRHLLGRSSWSSGSYTLVNRSPTGPTGTFTSVSYGPQIPEVPVTPPCQEVSPYTTTQEWLINMDSEAEFLTKFRFDYTMWNGETGYYSPDQMEVSSGTLKIKAEYISGYSTSNYNQAGYAAQYGNIHCGYCNQISGYVSAR